MIIVSAGIRPRDDLARACGLEVGERGGVVVNERLQASDPHIYAIGEVALYGGMIYGLVAPGWQYGRNRRPEPHRWQPAGFMGQTCPPSRSLWVSMSPASAVPEAGPERAKPLTWEDPFSGLYKKLLFTHDGTRLLGGVLVGDAARLRRALGAGQERRSRCPANRTS